MSYRVVLLIPISITDSLALNGSMFYYNCLENICVFFCTCINVKCVLYECKQIIDGFSRIDDCFCV